MALRSLLLASRLLALAGAVGSHGLKRRAALWTHNALWLYPTLRRNCQWHGPVVTCFETDRPEVWLTIDDGPDPRDTPEMLDLLARFEAKATFFAIGHNAEGQHALCHRIIAEGHTMENHTYSHPSGTWWIHPKPLVEREMERGSEAILEATGRAPRYFRSPVGMNNMSVHPAADRHGLRVIGWSADGTDGCPAVPSTVVSRIMRKARPGSIILLHESGASRRRALTLCRLLEALSAAGLRCVIPPEESLRSCTRP